MIICQQTRSFLSSGDQLTLDLPFATTKSLTARVGPTPTFTRASSGTFVDSSGLIQISKGNFVIQSQNLASTTWITRTGATKIGISSITDPDGGLNAYEINVGSTGGTSRSAVYELTGTLVSDTYTMSAWVRSVTGTSVFAFEVYDGTNNIASSNFTATTTWTRFTFTTTTQFAQFKFSAGSSGGVVGNILVYGPQLERASSAGNYIPTTTSAYFLPRFDHNPITLASRGLLIEESRTNLVLQSENHSSATWSKTGGSVASIANTAPDGSANSNLFSEDSSTGVHRIFQATAYTSGVAYTISVFLKYAGRQFIAIQNPAVASNNIAIFDIQNGVITLTQSSVTSSITPYPNGWYRCSVTGTAASTGNQSHIIQGSTTGNFLSGSYTGLNGPAFYIYGSQVEAGSFPTSYIPTTTASVVRSADVCSITNTSPFWNSSEFTMFTHANFAASGVDAYASNFAITGGSFGVRRPNTNLAAGIIRSSGVNADIVFGANGSFTTGSMRMALAHSTGQQAGSLNGATTIQQNSAFAPTSNPIFNVGSSNGSNGIINGHIVAIRYYKKRLPNAKLQALTV